MSIIKLQLEKNIKESEILNKTDGEISAAGVLAQMLDNQIVMMKALHDRMPEINVLHDCCNCAHDKIENDTEPCVSCFRTGGTKDNFK